jgi:toxin ParE1/3/4
MTRKQRRVVLAGEAERDFASILTWTAQQFGPQQARMYAVTLKRAIKAAANHPRTPGAKTRNDVGAGFWSLHIARAKRRGRHFLLYRVDAEDTITIVRILHDSMDTARHAPRNKD